MTKDDGSDEDYSASINLAIIDTDLGTSISGTTNLPRTLYESPKDERDNRASQLILQTNAQLKESEKQLTRAVHKILENPDSSEKLTSGSLVIVMNSNLYGSAIAGDVHQLSIAYIEEWNQKKNDIDIEKLKAEFEKIIGIMQQKARGGEHYEDLANLSFARDELNKADGPAMLKHLKKVGEFGLDIAKGIGCSLLAALLLA